MNSKTAKQLRRIAERSTLTKEDADKLYKTLKQDMKRLARPIRHTAINKANYYLNKYAT